MPVLSSSVRPPLLPVIVIDYQSERCPFPSERRTDFLIADFSGSLDAARRFPLGGARSYQCGPVCVDSGHYGSREYGL